MRKLKLEPGVVTGEALAELFDYCHEVEAALPAVNVIGSHSTNAVMAAAREAECPVIIQLSSGGARFFGGQFLPNDDHQGEIAGGIAGALYVHAVAKAYGVPVVLHTDHAARKLLPWIEGLIDAGERHFEQTGAPLYSSHMLDLSEETLDDNIGVSQKFLERMTPIGMTLEIELGVTGGEEDGVDNTEIDNSKLYTQPEDVLRAYESLNPVGSFTIAAAFGNTHGVYKPGNVKLTPIILKNSQEAIQAAHGTGDKPVHFVFHGGSGSTPDEIREAVSYGVVKMNVDTDTQWAFCEPIKSYMDEHDAYLHGQIGNPEGDDQPNKKHIDPRKWLHLGEKKMAARVVQSCRDLGAFQKFGF
jgi:fructose-bisphosphate aldolase class II